MAGIKEALKRVMESRNIGQVLANGSFRECKNGCFGSVECGDCPPLTKYLIIKLQHDEGRITVYDYDGGDIHISDEIRMRDYVTLHVVDNWNAEWRKNGYAGGNELKAASSVKMETINET